MSETNLPVWRVQQYESHIANYDVPAATEAEALAKVLNGDVEGCYKGTEYSGIDEERGAGLNDFYDEVVEEVQSLTNTHFEMGHMDSIRSIQRMWQPYEIEIMHSVRRQEIQVLHPDGEGRQMFSIQEGDYQSIGSDILSDDAKIKQWVLSNYATEIDELL